VVVLVGAVAWGTVKNFSWIIAHMVGLGRLLRGRLRTIDGLAIASWSTVGWSVNRWYSLDNRWTIVGDS